MSHTKIPPRTIGAQLIDEGLLTQDAVERTLIRQKEQGQRFGEAAVSLGLVEASQLAQSLARQYGFTYLSPTDSRIHQSVVTAFTPDNLAVEQYKNLRSQLALRWFNQGNQQLAICSLEAGEGRSLTAANLAVVYAQMGKKVLLIDADLRSPTQHLLFSEANSTQGLSSVLAGLHTFESAINPIAAMPGLSLLSAGAPAPNPTELLAGNRFAHALEVLAKHYDVIFIDTPAANHYPDSLGLARLAQGALLLARKNATGVTPLKRYADQLTQIGVSLVGSLLTFG
jgi:protein-tyrosine kinase